LVQFFERFYRREPLEGVGRVFLSIRGKKALGMAGMELRGVSKVFRGRTRALDALDLDIADGELLVLVGPSGSGKTTTLRLIAGLDRPTAGTIRAGGRNLSGIPARQRDVAMVFQHLGLYGHWSVRRNLAFGLELRERGGWLGAVGRRIFGGQKAGAIDGRVSEAARLFGIEALLDRPVGELSGGERQRVALGRALARRPAIWLLDEPLVSLDAPTRLALRRELKQLQRSIGTTTIYVTHDQAEALALADRIGVLHHGQLQQIGSPAEIYQRPRNQFVASFFGSQGLNLWRGRLENADGKLAFRSASLSLTIAGETARLLGQFAGQTLVMGLRPEGVELIDDRDSDRPEAIPATVVDVEDLGETRFAQLVVPGMVVPGNETGASILARCTERAKMKAGETAKVALPVESAFWFHGETGMNLLPTSDG
jgi:ABC-type sugar transport system ATPase subunit